MITYRIVDIIDESKCQFVLEYNLTWWKLPSGGRRELLDYQEGIRLFWKGMDDHKIDCKLVNMDFETTATTLWPDGHWTNGEHGGTLTTREVIARFASYKEILEKQPHVTADATYSFVHIRY